MSYYNYTLLGIYLADRSKVDLLKQFIDCMGLKPQEQWDVIDERIPAEETGLDVLVYSDAYYADLINQLFGRAYVAHGKFFGVTNFDAYTDFLRVYDPFHKAEAFIYRNIDCFEGTTFKGTTPFNLYQYVLEALAAGEGVEPEWETWCCSEDEDEEGIEPCIYSYFNIFTKRKQYIEFPDAEEGIGQGCIPVDLSAIVKETIDPDDILDEYLNKDRIISNAEEGDDRAILLHLTHNRLSVDKWLAKAEEKGYDDLVQLLKDYQAGVSHQDEGTAHFEPAEGTLLDRLLTLANRDD